MFLYLIYKIGPKKGRKNVRKIKVPTDTPTEFELGDTAADTQMRRKSRGGGGMPGRWKLHSHTQRREWPKQDQDLRGVAVKWTQADEGRAHFNHNLGARKDI